VRTFEPGSRPNVSVATSDRSQPFRLARAEGFRLALVETLVLHKPWNLRGGVCHPPCVSQVFSGGLLGR
jgi:hypothetical protein